MRVHRIGNLFPDKIRVSLPISYKAHISMVTTTGGGSFFQKGFSLNNMFNWDPAFTTHQPRGWNQWATMYESAYVVNQKVMCRLTPTSGHTVTNEVDGIMIVYQSKLSTAEITGLEAYHDDLERMRDPDLNARWARFSGSSAGVRNADIVKVTNKFYTRNQFTDTPLSAFTQAANGTTAPLIQREFHVYLRSLTMAPGEQMLLEVTATVDVVFFDSKNVDKS